MKLLQEQAEVGHSFESGKNNTEPAADIGTGPVQTQNASIQRFDDIEDRLSE